MSTINYLTVRNTILPVVRAVAANYSTLTGSTIVTSTITGSRISVSSISTNAITASTMNLQSTMISLGQSTNQTYNNFTNGSYLTWTTAKSAMSSANKTVQSANGQYQLIVANTTSDLFLSSDSGITWSTLTGGLPTLTGSAYWSDGAISANGQYITLSIYGGSLWMSADYGRTFALTNQPTPDIWLPLNGNTTDSMGLSVVTASGSPSYVTLNYPGYTAQAVNLANTAGGGATRNIRGTWTGASNFTVSFWFNAQSLPTDGSHFSLWYAHDYSSNILSTPAGEVRFTVPNGSGSFALVGQSSILPINTWHYVYMIFRSNGECSGYINNSLIGTYINVGGLGGLTTNMFSIGTTQYGNNAFNGYINDLRITNSVSTYVPIPLLQPNIWMPFENSTADLGSNVITPTVTGSLSYVPGVVGLSAVNLANTAGGTATNYIRGTWTGAASWTVSLWVNSRSAGARQILWGAYQGWVSIEINSTNQIIFVVPNGVSSSTSVTTSSPISLNTWYHVMAVFQSNGLCILYINGTLIGTYTNSGGVGSLSTSSFGVGAWDTLTSTPFNGYIDDFRIYNAAIPYHALFLQNYRSLALSGNGQYALASAASGWVVGSSDSLRTWEKEAVTVGVQNDFIQPNLTGLSSASWSYNGVNWVASASTAPNGGNWEPFSSFDNNLGTYPYGWDSADTYYNSQYTGSVSTTIQGGIGAKSGEWLQIQSSTPLILYSYTFSTGGGGYSSLPKEYYIVGSTDGSTWYPLQYVIIPNNAFTTNYTKAITYINTYTNGTFDFTAQVTVQGTSTAYSYTLQAWSYFRIIVQRTHNSLGSAHLGEWYINFGRPSASMLSLNHSGQYQVVATGPAAGSIMPNQTGLAAATWSQGGVNWGVNASSVASATWLSQNAFNNALNNSGANRWISGPSLYNASTGVYIGSATTSIQGIGLVAGEWLQLQSSVPLVASTYAFVAGDLPAGRMPRLYYIVGSMDGSTWLPLQYMSMATNPFTAIGTIGSYITINQTGTQAISGNISGFGTTTAYVTSTSAYLYFRLIITAIYPSNDQNVDIAELYLNFSNSVSYSSNYGSTWLNTSSTVSNESVSLGASGQYALSTNFVAPLSRLTLDNTNVDSQAVLVPATGAGTVTYSTSIKAVGTHSAYFNNTAGATSGFVYLNYTLPTVLNNPPAITISFWIHPTSLSGASCPLGFNNNSTLSGTTFLLNTTGSIVFYVWNNTAVLVTTSSAVGYIKVNTWYHIVGTYVPGTMSLYINGILASTATQTSILGLSQSGGAMTNLFIGSNTSNANAFAGYVDDVRIYTSALNADEISGLFKNPALTQTVAVSSSFPITSYSEPILPGITANVVDTAVSQTGQYMVAVTSSTTNNVYYSTDYGATFTALTIGSSAMVSCSISYDGSYLTVESATTVHTLNRNTRGFSVTVGNQAGLTNQAQNAIAIGNQAGRTNQSANSIVLNASGLALDAVASGFYVAPIATAASSSAAPFSILGYGTDNQVVQSSALTVLQNGNVGIGMVNPRDIVHVSHQTASNIRLSSTAAVHSSSEITFDNSLSAYWHMNGYGNNPTTSARGAAYAAGMIRCNNESGNNYENSYMTFWTCRDPQSDGTGGLGVLYERMRITSTGNVGIGTISPGYKLDVAGTTRITGSLSFSSTGSQTLSYGLSTTGTGSIPYVHCSSDLLIGWSTSPIGNNYNDVSNNLYQGISLRGSGNSSSVMCATTYVPFVAHRYGSGLPMMVFHYSTAVGVPSTNIGSISHTASTVSYNTTSDARLKENIEDVSDIRNMIDRLRPRTFTFIKDDNKELQIGFIAQELREHYPQYVAGAETEKEFLAMDYGKLSPFAIAACKDLYLKNDALTSTVTTLQAVNTIQASQIIALEVKLDILISWAQSHGFSS